jgi:hypothetical protein
MAPKPQIGSSHHFSRRRRRFGMDRARLRIGGVFPTAEGFSGAFPPLLRIPPKMHDGTNQHAVLVYLKENTVRKSVGETSTRTGSEGRPCIGMPTDALEWTLHLGGELVSEAGILPVVVVHRLGELFLGARKDKNSHLRLIRSRTSCAGEVSIAPLS